MAWVSLAAASRQPLQNAGGASSPPPTVASAAALGLEALQQLQGAELWTNGLSVGVPLREWLAVCGILLAVSLPVYVWRRKATSGTYPWSDCGGFVVVAQCLLCLPVAQFLLRLPALAMRLPAAVLRACMRSRTVRRPPSGRYRRVEMADVEQPADPAGEDPSDEPIKRAPSAGAGLEGMVVGPAGPGQLERHPSTEWESNVLTGAGAGNLSSRTSGPGVSG